LQLVWDVYALVGSARRPRNEFVASKAPSPPQLRSRAHHRRHPHPREGLRTHGSQPRMHGPSRRWKEDWERVVASGWVHTAAVRAKRVEATDLEEAAASEEVRAGDGGCSRPSVEGFPLAHGSSSWATMSGRQPQGAEGRAEVVAGPGWEVVEVVMGRRCCSTGTGIDGRPRCSQKEAEVASTSKAEGPPK